MNDLYNEDIDDMFYNNNYVLKGPNDEKTSLVLELIEQGGLNVGEYERWAVVGTSSFRLPLGLNPIEPITLCHINGEEISTIFIDTYHTYMQSVEHNDIRMTLCHDGLWPYEGDDMHEPEFQLHFTASTEFVNNKWFLTLNNIVVFCKEFGTKVI